MEVLVLTETYTEFHCACCDVWCCLWKAEELISNNSNKFPAHPIFQGASVWLALFPSQCTSLSQIRVLVNPVQVVLWFCQDLQGVVVVEIVSLYSFSLTGVNSVS